MSDPSANQGELVTQFVSVTGIDGDRAKFYLESAAWNLQVALASFYEDDSDVGDDVPVIAERNEPSLQSSKSEDASRSNKASGQPSRFGTIANFKKENSSDEEEGQAFYAGGSERSGQQVIGPGKKKNDIVSEMFKAAKEHGAEVVDRLQDASTSRNSQPFRGTGYRLGASETDTSVIRATRSEEFGSMETVEVTLKLWQNGFSINDGPLREYQESNNQEFLDSIRRGEIPQELIRETPGKEIALNMEDHRHEEFVAPKLKLKAFSGAGHMLGSPAPTVTIHGNNKNSSNETKSDMNAIKVDEKQPVTNVQIRFADGTRAAARLNETHTIGDLYHFVIISRPQYSAVPFMLMTTFPNKELTDRDLTLKQASLLNAVIVQRLQ